MNVPAMLRRVGRGLLALRSLPAVLRLYGRGLALVIVSAPLAGGAYFVLLAALSLLPVLQVWLTKLLLDAIAAGASGDQEAVGGAVTLAFVYALTLVVPAGLRPIQMALTGWLQDRSAVEMDRRQMEAGARLVDLYRIERPAFQDEVTMVRRGSVTALVLLVGSHANLWMTLPGIIIVGREIVVSALREWMAEMNRRGLVSVSWVGRLKTTVQMVAIIVLLANPPEMRPWAIVGVVLLYAAVFLTIWSMITYGRAAWPTLKDGLGEGSG